MLATMPEFERSIARRRAAALIREHVSNCEQLARAFRGDDAQPTIAAVTQACEYAALACFHEGYSLGYAAALADPAALSHATADHAKLSHSDDVAHDNPGNSDPENPPCPLTFPQ